MRNQEFIEIPSGVLSGEISIPPSKSITHRAFIIAALSGREVLVKSPLLSDDTLLTLAALAKMGYHLEKEPDGIRFPGRQIKPEKPINIQVGNSGTTARLITAVAAIQNREIIIDGSPRMRQRPMQPLINSLRGMGISIESENGSLPIHIYPGEISKNEVSVDASQSSQYLSALLLIAPLLESGLKIFPVGEVASRHYVDLTIAMMEKAGISVSENNGYYWVPPVQQWKLDEIIVEGDYSSAAYFLVGAHISGGQVFLKNLLPDSFQGDKEIIHILEKAGASCEWKTNGLQLQSGVVQAVDLDLRHTPDLVPTLAVMALFAPKPSVLRNIEHLHVKESDRISAIIENIKILGADAKEDGGNLIIIPGKLKENAIIKTFNDHRIAMSFALAGLRVPNLQIENPNCVSKSYPDFWDDFLKMIH